MEVKDIYIMNKEKNKPNTTLRLHPDLKKASQKFAETNAVTGGLSGLISQLLKDNLSKAKIDWRKQ